MTATATVIPFADSTAACPLCDGRGYDDTQDNQLGPGKLSKRGHGLPVCSLCRGLKRIDRSKVCTCGRPAVWYDQPSKLNYCGFNVCLNFLKARLTTHVSSML